MKKVNKLNLQLTPEIDAMLREIAEVTGLKMVRIISNGIKKEYAKMKEGGE
jgi:hypothetical protein